MSRRESKLYQDQLYGAKALSPLAVAVLDTPEMQRLGALKQLGFSDLVYRGAHHTRLAHSVGTYFVCRTMMRRITQNHERLGFRHPALLEPELSARLALNPTNADLPENHKSAQARWRGLTEIVSIAALLHDIGHTPFGHTLEDEFSGLYERHDHLAGPRLYTMLFDESSHLSRVFSDDREARWLPQLSNSDLRRLVYLILSWKEHVDPPTSFDTLLRRSADELESSKREEPLKARSREALAALHTAHDDFFTSGLFQPYMSDLVGNTICADLLDYLPRDRMNLGMDAHQHQRLQRYFTIRLGSFRENEGLRLSIMVNRNKHGGQRRDVATSILSIMRERYEMAERVYYHHKKAAAGAMLVKLLELLPAEIRPRDDGHIYPAPWSEDVRESVDVPHLVHLSDADMLEYLGEARVRDEDKPLQQKLYRALRYRRETQYRTLLVLDVALAETSGRSVSCFTSELREAPDGTSSSERRRALERKLESAAGVLPGNVIVYCPSQRMQAKEVDVRAEIQVGRVQPLRMQTHEFAYQADLNVLADYYKQLWRCYVFVSPDVFAKSEKCQAVVDELCSHFALDRSAAYRKVRTHTFEANGEDGAAVAMRTVSEFIDGLRIADLPKEVAADFLADAAEDQEVLSYLTRSPQSDVIASRLDSLLGYVTLNHVLKARDFTPEKTAQIEEYRDELRAGGKRYASSGRKRPESFRSYEDDLIAEAGRAQQS